MKRTALTFGLTIGLAAILIISAQAQGVESLRQKTARAETLNNQAVDSLEAGKIEISIVLLREAISLRPDYTIAYGNLGAALYRAGQFSEATVALKKALELKSDYAEDYNKLGAIYAETGKPDDAVTLFERAVQIQPDFAPAYYNLGCLHTRLKKFKKAKSALAQVIRFQPQNAEARLLLGQLYLLENDKQSALIQYKSLAPLNPALAQKLYSALYANLLITVAEK